MSTFKDPVEEDVLNHFREPVRSGTRETEGSDYYHTDAQSICRAFGAASYDGDAFKTNLMPNVLEYEWNSDPDRMDGGTDLLTIGKPGSGKSTFACHLGTRSIGVPRSKLVWRASPTRSEWLPLAPWATLCLPADVPLDVTLVPRNPTDTSRKVPVDELTRIVREVKYYDGMRELNQDILNRGQIHVVYPDPLMRGCQAAYESSDEKAYDAPTDRRLFEIADPSNHWWFGWVLDRVENGPHDWTTLILDEIGDIAPEGARKDQYGSYQKIELLKDCWVDARKKGLSIFAFGHSSEDIHNMIRRKIRWRCTMNQTSNPTRAGQVVGFGNVKMDSDITSDFDVGQALIWNERTFEKISWPNYRAPVSHKLEVQMHG